MNQAVLLGYILATDDLALVGDWWARNHQLGPVAEEQLQGLGLFDVGEHELGKDRLIDATLVCVELLDGAASIDSGAYGYAAGKVGGSGDAHGRGNSGTVDVLSSIVSVLAILGAL